MPHTSEPHFLELFDLRPLGNVWKAGLSLPIRLGFLMLLVAVGASAWLAYRHTQLLYDDQKFVTRTYQEIGRIRNVLTELVDAETGVRGYVLTGSEEYLAPYAATAPSIGAHVDDILCLAVGDPELERLLQQLKSRVEASVVHLTRVVGFERAGRHEEAIELTRTGEGKRLVDSVRDVIVSLDAREDARLLAAENRAHTSHRTAQVTGIVVGAVALLLVVAVFNLVRRFERLRSRTAHELVGARERFQVTLASIGDAVLVTDSEGRLAFCNEGCRSMLRIDASHMGHPVDDLVATISESTGQTLDSIVARVRTEGGIARTGSGTALRRRDGSVLPVDATAARIPTVDGQGQGVILVVRDLADRREHEREIERSHERFRSLVLATSQIVWTADAHGRMREDSVSWREFTGQSYEQMQGLGWLGALHDDDRERVLVEWNKAVAEKRPFLVEYRLRRADGVHRWCMVRAVPVRDPDGSVREWVGMNHDVQARKEVEELQRESNRRKDEFIALLAHELRNPLAPVRNGVAVLRASGPEPSARALEMMDRQLRHVVRLIDDLLDVSRIGRGKLELRIERVDLRVVLRQAVETTLPSAEAKHQHVSLSLPEQPMWVDGDPDRLTQVVTNLLSNAVKYSGEDGWIWLTAEHEGTRHVVSVRDTGQGIPRELLPVVWDMFMQGTGPMERSEGGLGIGLTLVKRLVELHEGTVSVTSDGPGTGSEFIVKLPTARSHVSAPAAKSLAVRSPDARPLRVLVVDDSEDSAESLSMLLSLHGHVVHTSYRGESAIEDFRRFSPEVVLCDIRMPDMSGHEVVRRIRTLPGGDVAWIVALTGYGTVADREASRLAGFDRHLVKPVDPDALFQTLNEAPRGRSA